MKIILFFVFLTLSLYGFAQTGITYVHEGRSIIFTNLQGERLRISPYGNDILRVQAVVQITFQIIIIFIISTGMISWPFSYLYF